MGKTKSLMSIGLVYFDLLRSKCRLLVLSLPSLVMVWGDSLL